MIALRPLLALFVVSSVHGWNRQTTETTYDYVTVTLPAQTVTKTKTVYDKTTVDVTFTDKTTSTCIFDVLETNRQVTTVTSIGGDNVIVTTTAVEVVLNTETRTVNRASTLTVTNTVFETATKTMDIP